MRVIIHYIEGHRGSEEQAQRSLESFNNFNGWEPEIRKGYTPDTLPEVPYKLVGRIRNLSMNKVACAMNHVRFYREIKESTVFAEHDSLCKDDWTDPPFEEYLCLSAESKLGTKYTGQPISNTASYVCSPKAAAKILLGIETFGLDKSEENIKRLSNLKREVLLPEVCTLQPNLNTSIGYS